MPELPDVKVFKRYLHSTALHQTIERISVENRKVLYGISPQVLGRKRKGHQLTACRRHGTWLPIERNAGAGHLVLHCCGMTDFLKYSKKEDEEPPHTRFL